MEEITRLRKRAEGLQKEIDALRGLPAGHGRLDQAHQLEAEQKDLNERIGQLNELLSRAPTQTATQARPPPGR